MPITIDGTGTITGATTLASTVASPTFTTPALGTPASGILTSCTGVPFDGFKNRIINGAMVIDQRNAGGEVNPAVTATYYLDRWIASATVASKYKIGQNAGAVTPPAGYTNYLGCTSLSAYTAGASEAFNIQQRIEGFNIADLAWGTASAATVTLSFQVYSSLTGTFGGSLRNSGTNRSYPFTYTISSANTWTQASVTIAGDTSGTWLTNNGIGMFVTFSLGAGATLSGPAGSWAAANYPSATGATSVVGTNGATFYITGVQLEKGSTASSFDYRSIGTELALCQRYFETNQGPGWQVGTATGAFAGEYWNNNGGGLNTYFSLPIKFAVYKRASPTVTLYSPGTGAINNVQTNYSANLDATSVVSTSFLGGFSGGMGASPGGAPSLIAFNWTSSSEL